MPIKACHAAEYRMKKFAKESAWAKVSRLKELGKHRQRCKTARPSIDDTAPHHSTHQVHQKERNNIEEVLGGAANWIGIYEDKPKNLCDARPWRTFGNCRPHPAPFSTLKLSPRGDKLRVIERNLGDLYQRIEDIEEGDSVYKLKKKKYLSRGESPWPGPREGKTTVEEKLEKVKKWEMKHRRRVTTASENSGFRFFFMPTKPVSASPPAQASGNQATAPSKVLEIGEPNTISAVTEEEAAKNPQLAQLKAVQEAGDPHF